MDAFAKRGTPRLNDDYHVIVPIFLVSQLRVTDREKLQLIAYINDNNKYYLDEMYNVINRCEPTVGVSAMVINKWKRINTIN